ncbi:hypothetical protein niasHT_011981 [Heterodera trifolii]|uniref:Fido domain-containing protein n=1 Tax=Heterodera trifolii TaxID=157864 RepID=A0ABD2L1U7_9BILA
MDPAINKKIAEQKARIERDAKAARDRKDLDDEMTDKRLLKILQTRRDLLHAKKITEEVLKELHRIACNYSRGSGEYRIVDTIRAGELYGPNAADARKQMKKLMSQLEERLADKSKAIVRTAIYAHLEILRIHIFDDSNGKTSRLFLNLILLQNGFEPIVIDRTKRHEYEKNLSNATIVSGERQTAGIDTPDPEPLYTMLENIIQSGGAGTSKLTID